MLFSKRFFLLKKCRYNRIVPAMMNDSGTHETVSPREIRWAARLQEEHAAICRERRIHGLSRPIIAVTKGRHTLGSWHSGTQTIAVSRDLITTRPWHLVIEVLKHEMAHQYVSEILCRDGGGHGMPFAQACGILGVHPAFRKPSADIDHCLDAHKGRLPDTARRMLEKVRKLTALGQSPNAEEARSALRKARAILKKHHLDTALADTARPHIRYRVICHKKKQVSRLQQGILGLLRTWYLVDVVITPTYDPFDDTEYKAAVLIGRPENLEAALYVYHFLFDTAGRLWQAHRQTHATRRTHKVDFEMGFITGVADNHRQAHEKENARENPHELPDERIPARITGLAAMAEKENENEKNRLFPRTRKAPPAPRMVSRTVYDTGFRHGKNTRIRKGVGKGSPRIKGLLT